MPGKSFGSEKLKLFGRCTAGARPRCISALLILLLSACGPVGEDLETIQLPTPQVHITRQPPPEGTFQVIVLEPAGSETPLAGGAEVVPPTPTRLPAPFTGVVLASANCRAGPGTAYEITYGFMTGERVDLLGVSSDRKWWVVRRNQRGDVCWMLASLLEVDPKAQDLPVYPAPPTPAATQGV